MRLILASCISGCMNVFDGLMGLDVSVAHVTCMQRLVGIAP